MKRQSEVELLQRYRRDRRELLKFILSAGIIEKIVTQPGTLSLDDVDFDKVSTDYVLECAKNGGALDLSEAVKKYFDELNYPVMTDSELGRTYLLVSNPESSGLPPRRSPPPVLVSTAHSTNNFTKSYPLHSTPIQQLSVEEIDYFEGDEEDDDSISDYAPRHQLNDSNELLLELPPFKAGLTRDDLRETAYEVLLASIGDALSEPVMANKEKKKDKKSRFMRKLTGSKNGKHKPQPQQTLALGGLLNTIRVQMEISESIDMQTREGLLSAAAGTTSKRMDTLLVPLELLCSISAAEFSDRRFYLRWQKRQLKILEEGLINHPAFGLKATESMAAEFRSLLLKIEEAEVHDYQRGFLLQWAQLRGQKL